MHNEIKASNLHKVLKISPVCDSSDPRSELLGKIIRITNPTCLAEKERDYIIREVQNNYKGDPCYRIYAINRETQEQICEFGRVLNPVKTTFEIIEPLKNNDTFSNLTSFLKSDFLSRICDIIIENDLVFVSDILQILTANYIQTESLLDEAFDALSEYVAYGVIEQMYLNGDCVG
ncbi:MAG: replication protein, partial [Gammaproteobacteria bacterium]|nr:replication protein [Gammaproteobacteria bacterium]